TICQYQAQSRTPAQWGDLVRAANPGYAGPWPRVTIWHGTGDTTVVPANATELRDQWTNVRGACQTPESRTSLPGGTTSETYAGGAQSVRYGLASPTRAVGSSTCALWPRPASSAGSGTRLRS